MIQKLPSANHYVRDRDRIHNFRGLVRLLVYFDSMSMYINMRYGATLTSLVLKYYPKRLVTFSIAMQSEQYIAGCCCCCCCCFLTLTDPLRIQPWSQDRRDQTKSNRESEISMESRQKRADKEVASKGHRRDKIENINKNTQTVETN